MLKDHTFTTTALKTGTFTAKEFSFPLIEKNFSILPRGLTVDLGENGGYAHVYERGVQSCSGSSI